MAHGVQESCPNVSVSWNTIISWKISYFLSLYLDRKVSVKLLIHYYLAIQCEVPANPENGRAVYASVSYNSLISYECTYGYMLIGDSVRRCERNKEWTGTQPHCKGKY